MNQRSLHSLFSRIVVLALPLAAEVGCGGATDIDGGGGTDSGGTDSGGSGGTGTGGVSMTGGAATGGAANCVLPPTSNPCVQPRTGVVARSCASAPPTAAECLAICGSTFAGSCSSVAQTNTTVTIQCPPTCVAGRRPPGFVEGSTTSSGLGAYFARAAELEGASVAAFRGLRAELRAWGAPRSLLRALSRAARDEQRHTRTTSALARRFGARALPPRVAPTPKRSLEAIALENVKEGCVRELYGALVATFQARTARDLQVRSAMIRIAHEETRHAALSLALQRWLEQRLDREALSRVAAAKRLAVSQLRRDLETQGQPPRAEQAGLPTARESERLFASLAASLPGLG